jgi:hypothetical protein
LEEFSEVSEVTAPPIWPLLSLLFTRLTQAHFAPEMVMHGVEGLITYWKRGDGFKKCLKDPLPKRYDGDEVV